jgi:tRNA 2-thiouridine synthesizing protein A
MTGMAEQGIHGPAPVAQRHLDVTQMSCPLPILKTKAEFAGMRSGEILCVKYVREEYVRELERFSRQTGSRIVHSRVLDDHWLTWIAKT